jgi:hypothetical protein
MSLVKVRISYLRIPSQTGKNMRLHEFFSFEERVLMFAFDVDYYLYILTFALYCFSVIFLII